MTRKERIGTIVLTCLVAASIVLVAAVGNSRGAVPSVREAAAVEQFERDADSALVKQRAAKDKRSKAKKQAKSSPKRTDGTSHAARDIYDSIPEF